MKKRKSLGNLSLKKSRISNLTSSSIKGGTGNPSLHSCAHQQGGPTCLTEDCGGTGGGTGGTISGPIYC